jgi:hypothetical protein
MSSCYTTVTASVVQVASQGALGAMIDNLKTRQIDIFASAYFTTRPFAHGAERESSDQPIFPTRTNQIKNKFEITRSFDLIYQLYLVIDLPGIATLNNDVLGTGGENAMKAWLPVQNSDLTERIGGALNMDFSAEGISQAGQHAHYTNNVAAALIKEVHLCMGGHSLSKLTGEQIYLYEELAGRPGKRLTDSVGKAESALSLAQQSAHARRLYLPMYFFFCSTRGSVSSALNLIGAQFQKATIDMSVRSLISVVENGDSGRTGFVSSNSLPAAEVYVIDPISTDTMTAPVRQNSGDLDQLIHKYDAQGNQLLDANDFPIPKDDLTLLRAYNGARLTLDVMGITLNEKDRNTFSTLDRMTLMDEVTVIERTGSQSLKQKDTSVVITDEAKNLIYEIQIAARVNKARSRGLCSEYITQGPLRFDGRIDPHTGETSEPLGTLGLTISGQTRFQPGMEAQFYNLVTPYMHHSTLPAAKGIYSMPFSMYPEDWNVPDSYANASKLDSMRLTVELPNAVVNDSANNGGVDLFVFCHTYNVLVEQKGMKARFFV